MIGEAAGAMMDLLLQDGMGLGVGWCGRCAPARRLTGGWVTVLMGGLTCGSGTNAFEGRNRVRAYTGCGVVLRAYTDLLPLSRERVGPPDPLRPRRRHAMRAKAISR